MSKINALTKIELDIKADFINYNNDILWIGEYYYYPIYRLDKTKNNMLSILKDTKLFEIYKSEKFKLISREEYIEDSVGKIFFCAYKDEKPVGFLYLKQTGKDTVELAVMGVQKEYHRNGIGKSLFECAKKVICEKGYSFIQVKTVQMGKYEDYDKTNRFYISLGFKEFEIFPTLWDEWKPCQIYVMTL